MKFRVLVYSVSVLGETKLVSEEMRMAIPHMVDKHTCKDLFSAPQTGPHCTAQSLAKSLTALPLATPPSACFVDLWGGGEGRGFLLYF